MPEKKKFEILGKMKKLELFAEVRQSAAELYSHFPDRLPSINGHYKAMPIIYSEKNRVICYSFLPINAFGEKNEGRLVRDFSSILLRFEELPNNYTLVWGRISDRQKHLGRSFEPALRIILENKANYHFFEIGSEIHVFSQVTSITGSAKRILQEFPSELKIEPTPQLKYFPNQLIEQKEEDYLIFSNKPPSPHIIFKLAPIEPGVYGVYYFLFLINDDYYNSQFDALCRRTIFEVKNKVEQAPPALADDPLTILKRRLAEGKISEEEFLRKKKLFE